MIRLLLYKIIIRWLSVLILYTKFPLFGHSSYTARSFLTTRFFCKLNPSNSFIFSRKSLNQWLFLFFPFFFFPLSSFQSSFHLADVLHNINNQQWAEYFRWILTIPTHKNHLTAAYCSICVFTKRISVNISVCMALLHDNVPSQLRDLLFWYFPYHEQTTEDFLVTLHLSHFLLLSGQKW